MEKILKYIIRNPKKTLFIGISIYFIFCVCAVLLVEYEREGINLWFNPSSYLDNERERLNRFNKTKFVSVLIPEHVPVHEMHSKIMKMDHVSSVIPDPVGDFFDTCGKEIVRSDCTLTIKRITYYTETDLSSILDSYYVHYITETSTDEGVEDVILNNVHLILISAVVIFCFSLAMMNFRIQLTSISLLCFMLSFVSATGVASIFGVSTNPLCMLIPFLLLCIGDDGVFIYHSAYLNAKKDLDNDDDNPEAITFKMYSHVTSAVTLSLVTTMLVMIFNMILPNSPAIFSFSVVGFLSLVFTWMYQVFMLPAVYIIPEFFKVPCIMNRAVSFDNWLNVLGMVKYAIFFIYIGYLCTSIYFFTQIESEFRVESVIDEKSDVAKYMKISDQYWEKSVMSTFMIQNIQNIDEEQIKTIYRDIQTVNRWDVVDAPIKNDWLTALIMENGGNYSYDSTKDFIRDHPQYLSDVILDDNTHGIKVARFNFREYMQTEPEMQDYMDSIPDLKTGFVTNEFMLVYNNVLSLLQYGIGGLVSTIVLLGITAFFGLSRNIQLSGTVLCMLISSLFFILGTLSMMGIKLDLQTQVNSLLLLGIQIDSFIHFIYRYSELKCVRKTLNDVGSPIMKGLMATSLGCVALFGASAEFFRIFALMFNVMVMSAGLHIYIFCACILK